MSRRVSTLAVLIAPAILYALTLFPGVGGRGNTGDSAKFQYIGEVLGVPHQPGYPQYVVLNFLFTRLPLPMELATQVNLLSALFALAAGAFLFLFFRELSGRTLPAALATWTVLLAETVWSYSTEAEVYSLHLLWVAAVSWAVCVWTRERSRRWLIALLVLYAFSFGNHPTMITLLPGLAVVLLSIEGKKLFDRRLVATTAIALALSLGQYGYVLWRSHSDAPFVEGIGRGADLTRLAESVRGDRFARKNLLGKGEGELVSRISGIPLETMRQLGPVGFVFAGFGVLVAFRRREPLRWYLVLGILSPAAFVAAYHVGDWQAYLTPAWVMLAGLAALCVGRMFRGRFGRGFALALWAVLLALIATVNFRSLHVIENEYDRTLLIAAAGSDAQLVTYRGPGYKAKQLNNYYRLGLRLEETRNLRFLTAKEAFEEQFAFLEERPLYFRDKRVKRFFDRHQVDYVQRWQNEDPLSAYYVTGARWPLDRISVVPAREDGALRIRSSAQHYLTDGQAPIEIAVVDGRTRRARGVVGFTFADGWIKDPKRLGLLGFTQKIRQGDWFFIAAQGATLRVNPATLARMGELLGFAPTDVPRARRTLVLAGRKGAPETLIAVADPETTISVRLRPEQSP